MEKVMSVEEKIRRAQEICDRRNTERTYGYKENTEKKNKKSFKSKLIKQLFICLIVYAVFYGVSNREYLLSNEFRNKIAEIASKTEITQNAYNYIITKLDKYIKEESTENSANDINNTENEEASLVEENSNNIGGSNNEENIVETEKSEEEQDVEYIKNTTTFIMPVDGTISSTFGWRNPTTSTVPKYHTGLDIAASKGTVIKSATDGTITLASSEGDYGNHYKITIGDITIIYAHCSKLYFGEGTEVHQGEEIAEVGSTGNSTGPHLHFEIRKNDRLVDPRLILNI